MVAVGWLFLLMLLDVKGREGVFDVAVSDELDNGMAVLAREAVNPVLCSRRRRPLSSVGSSGAVIAMARTRSARRSSAGLVRIIRCKAWENIGVRGLINGLPRKRGSSIGGVGRC